MHDQTLTIPQHADPIARGLLFGLLAAVLGLAVGLPAPPSEASTPILVIATPALAPLSARLDSTPSLPTIPPTNEPTDPPPESPAAQVDAPATAPTLQPPAPPAPEPPAPAQAYGTAGGTAPEAAPAEASNNEPLIASGPQVPQGPQQIHQ